LKFLKVKNFSSLENFLDLARFPSEFYRLESTSDRLSGQGSVRSFLSNDIKGRCFAQKLNTKNTEFFKNFKLIWEYWVKPLG